MESKNGIKMTKSMRKQKKAQYRIARDLNISCSDEPKRNLVICNAGLVTGFQREVIDGLLSKLTKDYNVTMLQNKSYCFISLPDELAAQNIYEHVHGRVVEGQTSPLYLTYSESVPTVGDKSNEYPEGLRIVEEFVSIDEEARLLDAIDWNDESDLKHRKVKHFGYEFRYDTNLVDPDCPITPIPQEFKFIRDRFADHKCGEYEYDQLTINHYSPGQGIPPHIDTHSVFEDTILSLSLGSAYVMDFKRGETKVSLLLPRRSLLIMAGESRYAWTHAICPRHMDTVDDEKGSTVQPRGTRISFTFRKTRRGDCNCKFEQYCDTKRNQTPIDSHLGPQLEHSHVHEVYEQISSHFNETRHKQWPNVAKFLDSIDIGGLLIDVGCGNGKYLTQQPGIFKIGCDRSNGLVGICRSRSLEVLRSDCLQLPFKSNSMDAAISIAVIHHLSTEGRRREAFLELLRVLRPGGRCLVYVWAKEQHKESKNSTYLRSGPKKADNTQDYQELFRGLTLPIHENRTNFNHSDVLVPWKNKGGGEFLRYYHVFEEAEFHELCAGLPDCDIEKIYYDEGNWCTILRKHEMKL